MYNNDNIHKYTKYAVVFSMFRNKPCNDNISGTLKQVESCKYIHCTLLCDHIVRQSMYSIKIPPHLTVCIYFNLTHAPIAILNLSTTCILDSLAQLHVFLRFYRFKNCFNYATFLH